MSMERIWGYQLWAINWLEDLNLFDVVKIKRWWTDWSSWAFISLGLLYLGSRPAVDRSRGWKMGLLEPFA